MVKLIFVNKDASLNEKSVNTFNLDTLHTKCGVKSEGFCKRHTWKVGNGFYSVYAKNTGRHSSENKYDLPPPVDEQLYFNTMVIVKHRDEEISNDNVDDLSKGEWEKTYETLFGGFENLDEHSSEMSVDEEEANLSDSEKTKEGYKKDGFVVDDDDEDDEDYVPENSKDDLEETETSDEYEDSEEEDSEGEDSEGEDSEGEDSEGEDSEGEDSEGEDSEGEESEGEESEGEESEGEESEGDESDEELYSELSEDSYCSSEEESDDINN